MSRTIVSTLVGFTLVFGADAAGNLNTQDDASPFPVVEVLAFKNGYAFVTREGRLPLADGAVTIVDVPQSILGTYWGYVRDEQLALQSVTALSEMVQSKQPAVSLTEILAANIGETIHVSEADEVRYTAVIRDVPQRTDRSLHTVQPPQQYDSVLQSYVQPPPYREATSTLMPASVVVLEVKSGEVPAGTRIVPLNRIVDATFQKAPNTAMEVEQSQSRIEMLVSGQADQAAVGVACLQRGIRWIPEYALTLQADGRARLKMQATLINDLQDLQDAKIRLAIGVPSFAFGDQLSPMALAEAFDRLSQFFQPAAAVGRNNANLFSNAIMSQSASLAYAGSARSTSFESGMNIAADLTARIVGPKEDLFIYELPNITLKKGGRMIVPVLETELEYEDAYVWDIAALPPPELLSNINAQQLGQLQALLETNRVRHTIEFCNKSKAPLTTGPVVILRDGQLIAQSLLPYTSVKGTGEVDLTVATDIRAKKSEREVRRTPNDIRLNNHDYTRIDLAGELELTNYKDKSAKIRIRRFVLGAAEQASQEAHIENINTLEDFSALPAGSLRFWHSIWPYYNWHYWPQWWRGVNRMSRIDWDIELEPGETTVLKYEYHYHVY